MDSVAPSGRVPYTRSIISALVPITRASSNSPMPAAIAFEAKVCRVSYMRAGRSTPDASIPGVHSLYRKLSICSSRPSGDGNSRGVSRRGGSASSAAR